MVVESPAAQEVNTFKFIQLRKLRIFDSNQCLSNNGDIVNLVSTSSRYGFIFVGVQDGFKVLKLENILDIDEDKQQFRIPAENYACQKVTTAKPVLLALSADDLTLAVCVIHNSRLVADMYDVRAFSDPDMVPLPFLNVQLSSECTELKDFMWNPVVTEMYAFCLGNGAVYVHELAETTLKIVADLPPATGATSVCWSPKGKQLVIGKKNGTFSQYKPTLQEVKSIAPPVLDENNNNLEVLNIHWISTTLFAVIYTVGMGNNKSPSLVFVSTPKNVPVSYTNCQDISAGGSNDQQLRYLLYYQSEWKILMCLSSNSIEVEVAGCEDSNKGLWYQWILEDSGRAELPLDGNKESYSLGMNVIYCAQRKIFRGETEVYPPMPLIFLLTSTGLLCPFHMLNVKPGAANIVYPSEPISRSGERKRIGGFQTATPPQSNVPLQSMSPSIPPFNKMGTPQLSSTPAQKTLSVIQTGGQLSQPPPLSSPFNQQPAKPAATMPVLSAVTPPDTIGIQPAFQSLSSTPKSSQPAILNIPSFRTPPNSNLASVSPIASKPTDRNDSSSTVIPSTQPTSFQSAPPVSKGVSVTSTSVDVKKPAQQDTSKEEKANTIDVINELKKFEKRLHEMREELFKPNLNTVIATKEEIASMKKNMLSFSDYNNKLNDNVKSLSEDVHKLKLASIDSFSLSLEVKSTHRRRHDRNFKMMLDERPLDPSTSHLLEEIHKLYLYLSNQLQEAHDRIDQDLSELMEIKKHKKKCMSQGNTTSAIYQSVSNNVKITHALSSQVEWLEELAQKLRLRKSQDGSCIISEKSLEETNLSVLAETLLGSKEFESRPSDIISAPIVKKKAPPNLVSALRETLANKQITCVRSTTVASSFQPRHPSSRNLDYDSEPVAEVSSSETPVTVVLTSSPVADSSEVKSKSAATNLQSRSIGGITQGLPIISNTGRLNISTPQVVGEIPIFNLRAISEDKIIENLDFEHEYTFYEDITPPLTAENSFQEYEEEILKGKEAGFEDLRSNTAESLVKTPFSITNISAPNVSYKPNFVDVSLQKSPHMSNLSILPSSNLPKEAVVTSPEVLKTINTSTTNKTNEKAVAVTSTKSSFINSNASSIFATKLTPLSDFKFTTDKSYKLPIFSTANNVIPPTTISNLTPVPDGHSKVVPATIFGKPNLSSLSPEQSARVEQDLVAFSSSTDPVTTTVSAVSSTTGVTSIPVSLKFSVPMFGPVSGVSTHSSPPELMKPLFTAPASSSPLIATSQSTNIFVQPIVSTAPSQQSSSIAAFSNLFTPKTTTTTLTNPSVATPDVTSTAAPSNNLFTLKSAIATPASSSVSTPVATSVTSPFASLFAPKTTVSTEATTASSSESLPIPPSQIPTTSTSISISVIPTPVTGVSTPALSQSVMPNILATSVIPSTSTVTEHSRNQSSATAAASPISSLITPVTFSFTLPSTSAASPSVTTSTNVVSTTTATKPLFGQSGVSSTTTPASSATTSDVVKTSATSVAPFGQVINTSSVPTNLFNQSGAPGFGQTNTTATSVFGQTSSSTTSPFSQVSSPSFGTPTTSATVISFTTPSSSSTTTSPFGQPGLFGTAPSGSLFGQKDQTSGTSVFGNQSAAASFSFGKPSTFGQQPASGSFGLAKAVFGQNPVSPSSTFGASGESSLFGQTGFMSGLGGKTNEQAASQNVFGSATPSQQPTSNLFGNQSSTVFGAKQGSFTGGSFSGGGGSVAQSGFGAFQQSPQKSAGFGVAASFGGNPVFGGSPPAFGGAPTFGGSPTARPFGDSSFGSNQSSFSAFANADAPTFGSLASSQPGTFSGMAQQPQQQSPVFGGGGGSLFGGGSPAPVFGTPAQSSFGSPAANTGSSAFSQWRS